MIAIDKVADVIDVSDGLVAIDKYLEKTYGKDTAADDPDEADGSVEDAEPGVKQSTGRFSLAETDEPGGKQAAVNAKGAAEGTGQGAVRQGTRAGIKDGPLLTAPTEAGLKAQDEAKRAALAAENRKAGAAAAARTRAANKGEFDRRAEAVRKARADAAVAEFGLGKPAPTKDVSVDEAAGQKTLFQRRAEYKPISEITVKLTVHEAESGLQVQIPEKADVAMRELDQQITLTRQLLECLYS